jgi:hypothetical protein
MRMISRRLLPVAVRLAAKARARGPEMVRTWAMTRSALLAARPAAAVEPVPAGLARGCLSRAGAARGGRGRVPAQPVRAGARGDQELGGGDRADAVAGQQAGGVCADQRGDPGFQLAGSGVQGQPPAAQGGQDAAQPVGGLRGGAGPPGPCRAQAVPPGPQLIIGLGGP